MGFGLVFTALVAVVDARPIRALLANNPTLMVVWYIMIYLIAGTFMVPLALALHERLKANAPAIMFPLWLLIKGVNAEQWKKRALKSA